MNQINFQRLLKDLASGPLNPKRSPDAAICERAATAAGESFDPKSPMIPWAEIMEKRDLTAAGVVSGQTLVGSDTAITTNFLRPMSIAARLGIPITYQNKNNLRLPRVTYSTGGGWLVDETTASAVGNDPVIDMTEAKPKIAEARLRGGYKFMQGGQYSSELISSELSVAMDILLEQAILQGTGASGQPLGLISLPGVGVSTGAFDRTKALTMEQTVAGVVGDDTNISFVTSPAMRQTVKEIQLGTSGRYLWNENGLVDRPGHVSKYCPDNTIFCGAWSSARIVLWGGGPQITVNPYSHFQSGQIDFQILMFCDLVFHPSAFFKWSLV